MTQHLLSVSASPPETDRCQLAFLLSSPLKPLAEQGRERQLLLGAENGGKLLSALLHPFTDAVAVVSEPVVKPQKNTKEESSEEGL